MRPIQLTLLLVMVTASLSAQTISCNCFMELDFAMGKLRKSLPYHAQRKEARQSERCYLPLIRAEMAADSLLPIHCAYYLGKAIHHVVRDKHLAVYPNPMLPSNRPRLVWTADEIRALPAQQRGVRYPGTVFELRQRAASYPKSALGGVYQNESNELAILLEDDEWTAYVLTADTVFDIGQRIMHVGPDYRGGYGAGIYINHEFGYLPVKSPAALLDQLGFRKDTAAISPHLPPSIDQAYYATDVMPGIRYVRLSTFNQTTYPLKVMQEPLYDSLRSLEGSLSDYTDLLIDLRSNPGGSSRLMQEFLKVVQAHPQVRIHVLVNRFTGSAAELAALELQAAGAMLYGERTAGVLSYGLTTGRFKFRKAYHETPCGYILAIPNTRYPGFKRANLAYEMIGIPIDLDLSTIDDWVGEVLDQIVRNR